MIFNIILTCRKIKYGFMNNQKGMALIMVISTIVFIVLLVQETVFETQIEYRSAIYELDALKAYHAAKSGMEVNLLRIKTYKKITTQYAQYITPIRPYLDLIWQFPFKWPLPVLDKNSTASQNEQKSLMDSQFITSLTPTASKIDINDLASPIPSLRKWTFQVLYRLINNLQNTSKKFTDENKLTEENIITLLYNIQDWADPNTQQQQQPLLSENILYNTQNNLPPNHSFITITQLHQIAGMSDIIYDSIEPFITVYGEKGLDINTAPAELIQSLHKDFSLKIAQEIATVTSDPIKPFNFTRSSFAMFLTQKGLDKIKNELIPKKTTTSNSPIAYIYFGTQHNFRMQSIGVSGKSYKKITSVYFNTASIKKRFQKLLKADKLRERKKIQSQNSSP